MSGSGSDEEEFAEVRETATPEGGAQGGQELAPSPEPAPQGQTAENASPWWSDWCDRIGAGEQGLDATWTALAFQLHAQAHA